MTPRAGEIRRIREALTLAQSTPFGVPEAHLAALHRLDALLPIALTDLQIIEDDYAYEHRQVAQKPIVFTWPRWLRGA